MKKYLVVEEIYKNEIITNLFTSLKAAQDYLSSKTELLNSGQPEDKAFITELLETYSFKKIDSGLNGDIYSFIKE